MALTPHNKTIAKILFLNYFISKKIKFIKRPINIISVLRDICFKWDIFLKINKLLLILDTPLVDLNEYFSFEKSDFGLQFENLYSLDKLPYVLNPYAHFGQPLIWPRGYPPTFIQQKNNSFKYICGKRKVSFVQQGLVNGDPDVDAIFRLTKSMEYKKIDIKFDPTSPSIQYPAGIMAPYNSQNTFFHYEAFWSLYLPSTVTFRLADIWRSYWAQRLMWLLDDTITFNVPNAHRLISSHSFLKDFKDEQAMFLQTKELIEFLYEWNCVKLKFYECVIDLSSRMANKGFWLEEEVISIRNWLDDLTDIGYIQPKMIVDKKSIPNSWSDYSIQEPFDVSKIMKVPVLDYYQIRYVPSYQNTIDISDFYGDIENIYDNFMSVNYLKTFCEALGVKLAFSNDLIFNNKSKYSHVSLVITFNMKPKIENILLIKHLYGSYFKDIIFCGSNILNIFEKIKNNYKRFHSFTFIEIETVGSIYQYYCMTKAIELNLNTKGYLLMNDDVILKYWLLDEFDIGKIWFPSKLECDTYELNKRFETHDMNVNWYKPWGMDSLLNVWNFFNKELEDFSQGKNEKRNIIQKFLSMTFSNSKSKNLNEMNVCAALPSNIFYLPKKYFKDFHYLSEVFRKFSVCAEMAVGLLLAGLERNYDVKFLNGTYKCCEEFDMHLYENMGVFGHAVKLSESYQSRIGKQFCNLFVQDKINYDSKIKN